MSELTPSTGTQPEPSNPVPCWESGEDAVHDIYIDGGVCVPRSVSADDVAEAFVVFAETKGWGITAVWKDELLAPASPASAPASGTGDLDLDGIDSALASAMSSKTMGPIGPVVRRIITCTPETFAAIRQAVRRLRAAGDGRGPEAQDLVSVRAALGGLPLEWEGDGEEDDGSVIAVSGAPLFKPFWPGDFPCNDVDDDELAKQVRDTHALARVIVAATNAVLYPAEGSR